MSVDEIDTILLLQTGLLTESGRTPILQQNYPRVVKTEINRGKKFSSL